MTVDPLGGRFQLTKAVDWDQAVEGYTALALAVTSARLTEM